MDVAEYAHRTEPTIGGFISIRLFNQFFLQPEVLLISKGPDVELDGTVTDTFEGWYIEIPVLARFNIALGEQWAIGPLGGPTFGLLRSFKLKDREDGTITDRTDLANSFDPGWLVGAGIRYAPTSRHAFLLEGRYSRSFRTISKDDSEDLLNSVVTVIVGYEYSPWSASSPQDSDRDGVLDAADQCPRKAEDRDGFEDEDGCPDTDNDRDGILDESDKCPLKAEDKDEFEDTDGCLDPDNDGDGIFDESDKCSDEAEDRDGFEDTDGCPELDNDRDRTPDGVDDCPNEDGGTTGVRGCPDGDGDGVADRGDYCPKTAGKSERRGCMRVGLSQGRLEIEGQVSFQNNGGISRGSYPLLDELAELLQAPPDDGELRLRITVYAATKDAAAQTSANTKKKEQARVRAEAVRSYLEGKGVSPDRMDAAGELESRRRPAFSIDLAIVR